MGLKLLINENQVRGGSHSVTIHLMNIPGEVKGWMSSDITLRASCNKDEINYMNPI